MSRNNIISIIIIVKNDLGIINTLDHLSKKIDFNIAEIVVVDSSENPVSKIYHNSKNIKWIEYRSKLKNKVTIPEQRNIGVKNAKGKIIVFIDANCIPANNWLNEITKLIILDREKIVAGSILSSTQDKRHDLQNKLLSKKNYLDEAPTMNLAIDKKVFNMVGYFDESFDYGSDVDFTKRAVKEGYKISYNPKAIVYHDWGSFRDELKRAFRYGEARVNIYRKHKTNIFYIIKNDPISVIYPLFILFLPLTFYIPWYPLFLLIPILKNLRHYPIRTLILNLTLGWGILNKFFKK